MVVQRGIGVSYERGTPGDRFGLHLVCLVGSRRAQSGRLKGLSRWFTPALLRQVKPIYRGTSPYSGRDCVKSRKSSHTGLYPQRDHLALPQSGWVTTVVPHS